MIPDSTSPVPAVASRGSPWFATSTRPVSSATIVVDPLSSTTQLRSRAKVRAASKRSAPGAAPVMASYSPSWGVSTRGHGRSRTTGDALRDRVQPVAIDHERDRRGRDHIHDLVERVRIPSQAGPDDEGAEPGQIAEHVATPATRWQGMPHHLRRRVRIVVDTGRAEADVAGSGALGATGSEVRRAGHPGRARRDPHRRLPLVRLRRAGRARSRRRHRR